MFKLIVIILLMIVFQFSSSSYYPYNVMRKDFPPMKSKYPETCCQLYWQDMMRYDVLPKSYVSAYLGSKTKMKEVAFVIARFGIDIFYGYMYPDRRDPFMWGMYTTQQMNPILVNPDGCITGYDYEYLKHKERYHPNINGNLAPQNQDMDETYYRYADYYYEPPKGPTLYVDCNASIPNMSTTKLWKMNIIDGQMEKLRNNRTMVVITNQTLYNYSPIKSKSKITFKKEKSESATLSFNNTVKDSFKVEKRDLEKWETRFQVELGFKIGDTKFGLTFGETHTTESEIINEEAHSSSTTNSNGTTSTEKESTSVSHMVTVPPHSKLNYVSYSLPYKGKVKVELVFQLTAKSGNDWALYRTLMKYQPSLNLHWDGAVFVKSAGEITLDVGYDLITMINTKSLLPSKLSTNRTDKLRSKLTSNCASKSFIQYFLTFLLIIIRVYNH